jgi:hypothetical protein
VLAPLLDWCAERPRRPGDPQSLRVGRGQIVGVSGEGWRNLFDEWFTAGERQAACARLDVLDGIRDCSFDLQEPSVTLWFVAFAGPPASETLDRLLARAEVLAERGCGVVIGADLLSDHPGFTRRLSLPCPPAGRPATPQLLDDAGVRVRYLRRGEWGAIWFPLLGVSLKALDTVRLEVASPSGTVRCTEPRSLDPWRTLVPDPSECIAELCTTWDPGIYSARLLLEARSGAAPTSPSLTISVRPSILARPGQDLHVGCWRFWRSPCGGGPRESGVALRLPATPVRQLDFDKVGEEVFLLGWHGPEPREGGGIRRWTRSQAEFVWASEDPDLVFRFEDLRPRVAGQPALTTLDVAVDDRHVAGCHWTEPGERSLRIPWPADGANHLVTLNVWPTWSPLDYGTSVDSRELGIFVSAIEGRADFPA